MMVEGTKSASSDNIWKLSLLDVMGCGLNLIINSAKVSTEAVPYQNKLRKKVKNFTTAEDNNKNLSVCIESLRTNEAPQIKAFLFSGKILHFA